MFVFSSAISREVCPSYSGSRSTSMSGLYLQLNRSLTTERGPALPRKAPRLQAQEQMGCPRLHGVGFCWAPFEGCGEVKWCNSNLELSQSFGHRAHWATARAMRETSISKQVDLNGTNGRLTGYRNMILERRYADFSHIF